MTCELCNQVIPLTNRLRKKSQRPENGWQIYEIEKAKIAATARDSAGYKRQIRELVERLKI